MMKLQAEYEGTKAKFKRIGRDNILNYAKQLKANGDYRDFTTRLAWDVGYAWVGTRTICDWYEKYNCEDSHITALFKAVLKELYPEALKV